MGSRLKNFFEKKNRAIIAVAVTFFLFGLGIAEPIERAVLPSLEGSSSCLSDFKFINPQPGCELYEAKLQGMKSLQNDLDTQIDGYLSSGRADRISVFTRDLTSQRFAGVNEGDVFYMASLLKLPLAIAYYRLSEITPDLLSQKATYTGVPDLYSQQRVQPSQKLTKGSTYTIDDLLYRALAYSDNTAAEILSQNYVSSDYLEKVLTALSLPIKIENQTENPVTAKSYAGVFRILYNSSFLSRDHSNTVLKTLSESDFTEGATALLPNNLKVAHKFGERTFLDQNGQVVSQLHDCGIMFAKNGKEPYTFCIMTEGKNFDDLKSIIQHISLTIFNEVVQ
jgi:beta-lactamase class A